MKLSSQIAYSNLHVNPDCNLTLLTFLNLKINYPKVLVFHYDYRDSDPDEGPHPFPLL